jgi:hypothetical protein
MPPRTLAAERPAGLAGLDPGAGHRHTGFAGLAADRTTGISSGAAARTSRGTSPASNASRFAVERLAGLAGLDAGALARCVPLPLGNIFRNIVAVHPISLILGNGRKRLAARRPAKNAAKPRRPPW